MARAAAGYAHALDAAPGNVPIALRAYREALKTGDLRLADRAAATLSRAGEAPADVQLLMLAEAAAHHDRAAADSAIAAIGKGPLAILVPSLRGWAAVAAGGDPLAVAVARPGADAVATRFVAQDRALLAIAAGHSEQGLAALRPLLAGKGAAIDLRIAAARLLAGQGRGEEAQALLAGTDALARDSRLAPDDTAKPTLAFGAAQLFTRVAADLAVGDPTPLSIALTRAALIADPHNDRARLLLAVALSGLDAPEPALSVLDDVDAAGPFAAAARSARVSVLVAADDPRALAAAQALAGSAAATPFDLQRYGDLLVAATRYDDAAAVYRRLIARGDTGWAAWLQYGAALDEGGHWSDARVALTKAVELGPDQPLALNYLGYAQIEHGQDVASSRRMLEKAYRLEPDDASITDSLAWAYYRAGEVARALPMFERAAAGEPDNSTIFEHLGDAYWSTGRRFDARYAWRAALVLADGDADMQRLHAKIADGLPGRAAH